MNFHYDPILGLQYFFVGNIIEINLDELPRFIPEEYSLEEILQAQRELGISLCNLNGNSYAKEHSIIHTNA